ncbi:FecCD family ABC transporter permease [Paenarthrobacter sp. NPDC090522]|uniref:FecCD family ABC transporter permease n=1 Tax=Paenarthrobacter sp. NPDC090522 TaxID=3364383 RepID=UPI00380F0548
MSGLAPDRSVLRGRTFRTPGERFSVRWQPRAVAVCAVLAAGLVIVAVLSLTTGDYSLSLTAVVDSLFGHGTGLESFVVSTLRLPRVVTAVLVGAALGLSGAVFQSLSRNPLGSPDVVGFTSGAAAAAVLEILVFGGGPVQIAGASIVGGLGTALVVYLISFRRGATAGYRLILVGIGISAMLGSVTAYLLVRANLYEAQSAQVWLIGSLNGAGWGVATPLAVALALLVPLTLTAGRSLALLEMGDQAATALGIAVERTRFRLVIVASALTAAAVAAAGPIAFVALAAPQLSRRLTGNSGVPLVPSAFMGALLLSTSDFGAQRAFPLQLPVGLVTGLIGGMYLCWLLVKEWKNGK